MQAPSDAHAQTGFPALRIILAASAAMEDVDRALARLNVQIEEAETGAEALGRPVMSGSRLLKMSGIYMNDRDSLERCLSRACARDDAEILPVPKDCAELLANYLHDQLPKSVLDLVAETRPGLVEALTPQLSAAAE